MVVALEGAASLPSAAGERILVAEELLQPGEGPGPPLPWALCPILQWGDEAGMLQVTQPHLEREASPVDTGLS